MAIQVEAHIREHINKYYENTIVCSDCEVRTRMMSVYGRRCVSTAMCRGEMRPLVSAIIRLCPEVIRLTHCHRFCSTRIRNFITSCCISPRYSTRKRRSKLAEALRGLVRIDRVDLPADQKLMTSNDMFSPLQRRSVLWSRTIKKPFLKSRQ